MVLQAKVFYAGLMVGWYDVGLDISQCRWYLFCYDSLCTFLLEYGVWGMVSRSTPFLQYFYLITPSPAMYLGLWAYRRDRLKHLFFHWLFWVTITFVGFLLLCLWGWNILIHTSLQRIVGLDYAPSSQTSRDNLSDYLTYHVGVPFIAKSSIEVTITLSGTVYLGGTDVHLTSGHWSILQSPSGPYILQTHTLSRHQDLHRWAGGRDSHHFTGHGVSMLSGVVVFTPQGLQLKHFGIDHTHQGRSPSLLFMRLVRINQYTNHVLGSRYQHIGVHTGSLERLLASLMEHTEWETASSSYNRSLSSSHYTLTAWDILPSRVLESRLTLESVGGRPRLHLQGTGITIDSNQLERAITISWIPAGRTRQFFSLHQWAAWDGPLRVPLSLVWEQVLDRSRQEYQSGDTLLE